MDKLNGALFGGTTRHRHYEHGYMLDITEPSSLAGGKVGHKSGSRESWKGRQQVDPEGLECQSKGSVLCLQADGYFFSLSSG